MQNNDLQLSWKLLNNPLANYKCFKSFTYKNINVPKYHRIIKVFSQTAWKPSLYIGETRSANKISSFYFCLPYKPFRHAATFRFTYEILSTNHLNETSKWMVMFNGECVIVGNEKHWLLQCGDDVVSIPTEKQT